MKILVTGANGFLGSWVTRSLVDQGHEVRILARTGSDLSELAGIKYETHIGDVTDLASVKTGMKDVESVFHLAGVIAYQRSQRALMEKVNVGGTENVIAACVSAEIKNFVYLSSVVAVGAGFDENQILSETSAYNLKKLRLGYFDTKHAAELCVKEAHEKGLVDAVIVNPSTVYGPGDAKKGSRKTQLKVAQGRFPFFTSGGVNVISIEDFLSGLMTAWKGRHTGERFLLCGENLLIKDLLRLIAEAADVNPPYLRMPDAALFGMGYLGDFKSALGFKSSFSVENAWSSTLYHWFDNSKARRVLGLNPKSAKFAISESVAWSKAQGLLNSLK